MSIFLMKLIREETEHKLYQSDSFYAFRFSYYRSDLGLGRIRLAVPPDTYQIELPPIREANWEREYLITREEAIELLNQGEQGEE